MTAPSAVQLLLGSARFVVASTPKRALGLFVKANWNVPSLSFLGLVRIGGVGSGTLTLRTIPVLGMPFTKIVAIARPGGKPITGTDVNVFVDQFVVSRNSVRSLSMLRNCING